MQPRSPCASVAARSAAAAALALLVAFVVAQADPTFLRAQDKKDPDKKEAKLPEYKWPTEINGKDLAAVLKDMEDRDPTVREFAARTLPMFGPPAQKKDASAMLIKRMRAETDPGVKCAVFDSIGQIQFDSKADNKEALDYIANVVDTGPAGSQVRLHAIQTVAMFGPKGEPAITKLTGVVCRDPAYEIRRSVAHALGRVGYNETTGPSTQAHIRLAETLAADPSAAVRLEALQSLMLLGPPWAETRKPDDKTPPKIKTEEAAKIIKYMRARVGDPKNKIPAAEKDKQVEIWARLVLMRFDPREVNDDNINAFANFLSVTEPAVQVQALNAIVIVGELASKRVNDVIRVLEQNDPTYQLTMAAINALGAMGAGAKPALPSLKKLRDAKKKELDTVILELAKKKDDPQLTGEKVTLEILTKSLDETIKHIEKAEPKSPAVSEPPKKP